MSQRTCPYRMLPLFPLCTLVVTFLTGATAAQTTFPNTSLYSVPVVHDSGGQGASALAVADLNGDGKPDIVVVNLTGATFDGVVGVLINAGSGSFRPVATYDSGGRIGVSVELADLNGDGKLDIVVANQTDNANGNIQMSVLLGIGDGTFQSAKSYDAGGVLFGLGQGTAIPFTIADVNGDHIPDLVVGSEGKDFNGSDGVVGVLLGKGDGTFQPVVIYDSGASGLSSLAVGDLNKDGRPDLVVVNCNADATLGCSATHSTVGVLLGQGNGTFGPVTTFDKGGLGNLGSPVTIADLNHDGNLDLIVGNYCPGFVGTCSDHATVGVFLGRGDGTFQGAMTYDSGGAGVGGITVADVNGDGKLDLLVAAGPPGVLLGNGDGAFQPVVSPGNPGGSQVFVVDVNGDGKLDLVACGNTTRNVGIFLGHGDGTFDPGLTFQAGGATYSWATIADVSGDGKPDIVTANWQRPTGNGSINGTVGVLLHANLTTATALASSLSPSFFGQLLTFTATVTSTKGLIPDGELVTFKDGGKILASVGLTGGVAKYTTSALSATKHSIQATYTGDNWFAKSSRTLTQTVAKDSTATTLTASPNPSKAGQAVTLTAHVTNQYGPSPVTGTVKFFNGTTALGTATLSSGTAKLIRTTLAVGTHSITAQYLGNSTSAVSTSGAVNQVVQ